MKLITQYKSLRGKFMHRRKIKNIMIAKDNERKIYNVKSYYNYSNIFFISKTLMTFNFSKNLLFLSH